MQISALNSLVIKKYPEFFTKLNIVENNLFDRIFRFISCDIFEAVIN